MKLKKIKESPYLFWYFKKDMELDLGLDWAKRIYIKEVLTRGKQKDIKEMFGYFDEQEIKDIFESIKRFIPERIRNLWVDYFERTLGNNSSPT